MKHDYCYKCGNKTEKIEEDGYPRDYCSNCHTILYENPIPSVAICGVNDNNELLLVKRAVEPAKGKWCLPGGFVEAGETVKDTVLRELEEETGLTGDSPTILDIYTHTQGYYGDIILICFYVESLVGKVEAGDDAAEAQFFKFDRLPDIAFKGHRKFIEKYKKILAQDD